MDPQIALTFGFPMYLQRPRESASRGRFLLALTLSTVTAAAVAAPLALKAVSAPTEGPASPGEPAITFSDDTDAPFGPGADDSRQIPTTAPGEGRGNIAPAPDSQPTTTVAPTTTTTTEPTTTTEAEPETTVTTEVEVETTDPDSDPDTTDPDTTDPETTDPDSTATTDPDDTTTTTEDPDAVTTTTEPPVATSDGATAGGTEGTDTASESVDAASSDQDEAGPGAGAAEAP